MTIGDDDLNRPGFASLSIGRLSVANPADIRQEQAAA